MSYVITPVILCGGNGTRLWPLSRSDYPKQFLSLTSNLSMLQETISRLDGLECGDPLIVCNEKHRFLVAEQLQQIGKLSNNIILEPEGKNTAPAIALASLAAKQLFNRHEHILLVLAADHVINDSEILINSIVESRELAIQGKLVTFGIMPTCAETGYGYIKRGSKQELLNGMTLESYKVAAFVEKPSKETAQTYLESGDYFWNSGMFLFRADIYLNELRKYRADILNICSDALQKINLDMDFIRVDANVFKNCPNDSIDYAVMEKTDDAVVVPLKTNWSDVGSWDALWNIYEKDDDLNSKTGDVICLNSSENLIYSESALITALGVKGLIIIQTKDAILVANKNESQYVKQLVDILKYKKRNELTTHREVFRPWGKYESLDEGERYQVKRLTIRPGEGISLQLHHHRAEHWIIVSGTAKVSIDGNEKIISENESAYIPVGAKHTLENPGKIPLDLIEVRSGTYLEEDDIVRIADRYGRL
ncbi:mannose-1-phosphate guanylyltransferase/mannose-6-phosphate isomerase [Enterobacter hormaechei]|uniref:mannose-1-phosphate guanylyltransferase/mannose-6-phosphate isomerase n=1 Tax=Enterobacter hormaechei TaxID=158836 RepID=UPI000F88C914|nr:mannose-1-phosphate guanylyltransferase/mannose-6-phosphate isomerase [Enterobacter hormaechei]RTO96264.1 mannose-1-phosphate guanylyltransferase/mannose-6-phosphate isomerase [Enterobacter hormaechei]